MIARAVVRFKTMRYVCRAYFYNCAYVIFLLKKKREWRLFRRLTFCAGEMRCRRQRVCGCVCVCVYTPAAVLSHAGACVVASRAVAQLVS